VALDGSAHELVVTFDRETVSLDAVQRAAYALADRMTVDIAASDRVWQCKLMLRSPMPPEDMAHCFRAEVNDQILRLRIGKETEGVRNLIFALAFSQTGLVGEESDSL
jgi:His-Xaa-Ser system protein HxsD